MPHADVAEVAVQAARGALPESVSIGAPTPLPRGADAFIGTERPLLLGASRWAVVSPGGIVIGGSAAAMAAVLGFEVPARPAPVDPETHKPGDPLPPRWSDLVVEAARSAIISLSHAVGSAVIEMSGLPGDWAATQVSMNDTEVAVRSEVGPIPDAVVVVLHAEEHQVRLVIVVPGIFSAIVGRDPAQTEVRQTGGGALVKPEPEVPRSRLQRGLLSRVPIDLAVEMGRARVPLSHVLHLQDGEVLELQQATDAPVDLVTEDTAVASGNLEVTDQGTLVLHVTSIPGRPSSTTSEPRVMADAPAQAAADSDPGEGDAVEADAGAVVEADSGDAADAEPDATSSPTEGT